MYATIKQTISPLPCTDYYSKLDIYSDTMIMGKIIYCNKHHVYQEITMGTIKMCCRWCWRSVSPRGRGGGHDEGGDHGQILPAMVLALLHQKLAFNLYKTLDHNITRTSLLLGLMHVILNVCTYTITQEHLCTLELRPYIILTERVMEESMKNTYLAVTFYSLRPSTLFP
jgi:hypothetical protein